MPFVILNSEMRLNLVIKGNVSCQVVTSNYARHCSVSVHSVSFMCYNFCFVASCLSCGCKLLIMQIASSNSHETVISATAA